MVHRHHEHRMHYDSAYTKNTANSGVDQGCPLSACGFSAVVDPVLRSVVAQLCTQHDSDAKLFAYLDDWYLWIKPQFLLQTIAVITDATKSVNLFFCPEKIAENQSKDGHTSQTSCEPHMTSIPVPQSASPFQERLSKSPRTGPSENHAPPPHPRQLRTGPENARHMAGLGFGQLPKE